MPLDEAPAPRAAEPDAFQDMLLRRATEFRGAPAWCCVRCGQPSPYGKRLIFGRGC
ncbi:MAG TPA: hypothetical protein VGM53_07630 [Streptosporangiaceae bacterium]